MAGRERVVMAMSSPRQSFLSYINAPAGHVSAAAAEQD